jgi:hypothetical protein
MCKIVLLDCFHHLNYKTAKSQCFRSWVLFPSAGKRGEGGKKVRLILLASCLRMDDGQNPKERLHILFQYNPSSKKNYNDLQSAEEHDSAHSYFEAS